MDFIFYAPFKVKIYILVKIFMLIECIFKLDTKF